MPEEAIDPLDYAYDRLNDLLSSLEVYQGQARIERSQTERDGLQELLQIQLNRVELLLDYLGGEADEIVRDMIDRQHVIAEARAGRFT